MDNFDKLWWTLVIIAFLIFGVWNVLWIVYIVAFAIGVVKLIDWIIRKAKEN